MDSLPNIDVRKQVVDFDYDCKTKSLYYCGMDKNGNLVRVDGYPTSDIGSLLVPEYEKRDRPFSDKSKEKVCVKLGGEVLKLKYLIDHGIVEKKKLAEFKVKSDDAKKNTINFLGGPIKVKDREKRKEEGETKFYNLDTRISANIADTMFNMGRNFDKIPNTRGMIIEMIDGKKSRQDKIFTFKLTKKILEICKSEGRFMEGLFVRRLRNAEAIVGRELDDKERKDIANEFRVKENFKDFKFRKYKGEYELYYDGNKHRKKNWAD